MVDANIYGIITEILYIILVFLLILSLNNIITGSTMVKINKKSECENNT